jgi:hypothetical protein
MWFQNYLKYEKFGEYIVQMIGYCDSPVPYELGHEEISIYEYMPGGTLQQRLHGELLFHIVQSKSK